VIIPTAYKASYDKIIEENTTYTLSNFIVLNNDLAFKASDHKYKLKWTGGATAAVKFKPFAEILVGKWRADLLVREFVDTFVFFTINTYRYVILI